MRIAGRGYKASRFIPAVVVVLALPMRLGKGDAILLQVGRGLAAH
jgi:hypothetical protein